MNLLHVFFPTSVDQLIRHFLCYKMTYFGYNRTTVITSSHFKIILHS